MKATIVDINPDKIRVSKGIFFNAYLSLRERERERERERQNMSGGEAERERETQNLKQAPQALSCQHRARHGARTPEP